jgi:hypothetical protein
LVRWDDLDVRITEASRSHHGCASIPRQGWRVIRDALKTPRDKERWVPLRDLRLLVEPVDLFHPHHLLFPYHPHQTCDLHL